MSQQNLVTVIVVVLSAVIPYLISQNDVVIPPVAKVALTALNIGLLAFARLSNGGTATTTITTPAASSTTVTTDPTPKP